ncbi:MAG TPA: AMP-binding protein, partial [Candidatus Acidoferrum sp.]|nr:AMP-binding protein [Candidatus Acidoferrum sp.]
MRPMLVDILCRAAGPRPVVSDPNLALDCAALCNAADAIGAALCARGVAPGDRVASVIPDGVAFLAAFAGTAAARAAFIPLPSDDEAAGEALERLSPRIVLTTEIAPQRIRVAGSSLGIPLATIAFDDQGVVLVDGEYVYESNDRIPEDDDVVFMP